MTPVVCRCFFKEHLHSSLNPCCYYILVQLKGIHERTRNKPGVYLEIWWFIWTISPMFCSFSLFFFFYIPIFWHRITHIDSGFIAETQGSQGRRSTTGRAEKEWLISGDGTMRKAEEWAVPQTLWVAMRSRLPSPVAVWSLTFKVHDKSCHGVSLWSISLLGGFWAESYNPTKTIIYSECAHVGNIYIFIW